MLSLCGTEGRKVTIVRGVGVKHEKLLLVVCEIGESNSIPVVEYMECGTNVVSTVVLLFIVWHQSMMF